MTRDVKKGHGYKGQQKGNTGNVFSSPLVKKAANSGRITILED